MERNCKLQGFLESTIEIWQPRMSRNLTTEDAREILENMTGFFRVLMEWDAVEPERTGHKVKPQITKPSNTPNG